MLESHESARNRGKAIGGAAVTNDAMLAVVLHLRGQNLSLRDIAARLVIATGKKKGQHRPRRPCCASTMRRPPRQPSRRTADRAHDAYSSSESVQQLALSH